MIVSTQMLWWNYSEFGTSLISALDDLLAGHPLVVKQS